VRGYPAFVDRAHAKAELIRGLQLAHSGEWGAIRAYLGHRKALQHGPDREMIRTILVDEIRHRRWIGETLARFGSAPDPRAQRKLNRVGCLIAAFCRIGGYYAPMYGAGRLERDNIEEYEILARLAWHAGEHDLIDELLHLGEVEWDHEALLRRAAEGHWLWRFSPKWRPTEPRERIRASFEAWTRDPAPVVRRKSWLVR